MTHEKTYLGDAVYAEFEDGMLMLTTSDGLKITNRIYLEENTYNALVRYVNRLVQGNMNRAMNEKLSEQ